MASTRTPGSRQSKNKATRIILPYRPVLVGLLPYGRGVAGTRSEVGVVGDLAPSPVRAQAFRHRRTVGVVVLDGKNATGAQQLGGARDDVRDHRQPVRAREHRDVRV